MKSEIVSATAHHLQLDIASQGKYAEDYREMVVAKIRGGAMRSLVESGSIALLILAAAATPSNAQSEEPTTYRNEFHRKIEESRDQKPPRRETFSEWSNKQTPDEIRAALKTTSPAPSMLFIALALFASLGVAYWLLKNSKSIIVFVATCAALALRSGRSFYRDVSGQVQANLETDGDPHQPASASVRAYGSRWAGKTLFNLIAAPIVLAAVLASVAWLAGAFQ
jgi:hypothetical protein